MKTRCLCLEIGTSVPRNWGVIFSQERSTNANTSNSPVLDVPASQQMVLPTYALSVRKTQAIVRRCAWTAWGCYVEPTIPASNRSSTEWWSNSRGTHKNTPCSAFCTSTPAHRTNIDLHCRQMANLKLSTAIKSYIAPGVRKVIRYLARSLPLMNGHRYLLRYHIDKSNMYEYCWPFAPISHFIRPPEFRRFEQFNLTCI